MLAVILVSGPPFDTPLWEHVEDRLKHHNMTAASWPMFEGASGDFSNETQRLVQFVESFNDPVVLVGHGLANPLVMAAANATKLAGLVLSNGPLSGPDRLTRAVQLLDRTPHALALPFLRSSFGLRRMVVNPYVMDHDTTVAVCGPILAEPARRAQMRNFLQTVTWSPLPSGLSVLLCQGDSDFLSCQNNLDLLNKEHTDLTIDSVPGGRPLHPLERPWELADRLALWSQNSLTATQMS